MFKVSISIGDATVSSKANSIDDVWDLLIPAFMAAGFDQEIQVLYSLHDYVEKGGKYLVMSQEDYDLTIDCAKKEAFEEGVASARSNTEALVDDYKVMLDEQWAAGYEAGLLAGKCNAA